MKEKTIERIRKFTEERDWEQFHTPANLAKSIVIEAAELLECFQWSDTEYNLQHIKEELADVLVYSQNLLDKLELDADEIVNMKMKQNEAKYPVDKAKGNTVKISKGANVRMGDLLSDLRGNRFEVSGIEMFRRKMPEGKTLEDMPLKDYLSSKEKDTRILSIIRKKHTIRLMKRKYLIKVI